MSDASSRIIKADTKAIDEALQGLQPVILWLSQGRSPSLEVRKALDTASTEYADQLTVLIADSNESPELKERFSLGKHPVVIGAYQGEIVNRRSRPWAADIEAMATSLIDLLPKQEVDDKHEETAMNDKKIPVDNAPVQVTDATFEKEVLQSELPVLVDFWAEWCGPCRMVAPILEKLADEYAGKVRIAKVDVDHNPGLAQAFRIMSIPTLMFIKEGKIVGQTAGALPEPTLRDALEQLISLEIPQEA